MHDEWQSGERHYLSEGSMAQLKPTSETGGIEASVMRKLFPAIHRPRRRHGVVDPEPIASMWKR